MLSNLRNFSKSKLAVVLTAIIIIPFVFWGMGSVFSGGNTNNVAKINNKNISTKDFIKHLNLSNIDQNTLKKNIEDNVLEDLLTELISINIIDLEIKDLELSISEKSLVHKIKNNKEFFDEKNNFSRLKYEKFLLKNNISAGEFERRYKNNELQKILFSYISGGITSPHFLTNKIYINKTKKIEINYVNLNNVYRQEFTNDEVAEFIKNNKEKLMKEYIDFSYIKITPNKLIQIEEFNDIFFKKIDEIENLILNGADIKTIANNFDLKLIDKIKYINEDEKDEILSEIYNKRNDSRIQLIDKNDYYILYELKKIEKILPNKNDSNFLKLVNENLKLKDKFNFNKEIFLKIQDKKFSDDDFNEISKKGNLTKSTTVNSINDNSIFDANSINLLYSLPEEEYLLMSDNKKNIFLVQIKNIEFQNLSKDSNNTWLFEKESDVNIKNDIYSTYDYFLNEKYEVKIFQKSIERVKNYFR